MSTANSFTDNALASSAKLVNNSGSGDKNGKTLHELKRSSVNLKSNNVFVTNESDEGSGSDQSEAEGEIGQNGSSAIVNNDSSSDSSSGSDYFIPVIKVPRKKKIKREPSDSTSIHSKTTLPPSPIPSSISSSSYASSDADDSPIKKPEKERNGPQSPETPDGQWEIEEIRDFIRDDYGDMYLVKWKDWGEEYNTWEPIGNLLNCDDELLRFYKQRKLERKKVLENSHYTNVNGKRRRNGPALPDVPPDPRPFDDRVEHFFNKLGYSAADIEKQVMRIFGLLKAKKLSNAHWPMSKINNYMENAMDEKLSEKELRDLREELIILEVEKRNKAYSMEMRDWEAEMNKITGGHPQITVENDIEITPLPTDLMFVNDYVPGEGVEIPNDPPVGCRCGKSETSCYDSRSECCAAQFGQKFAYTRFKKMNLQQGSPVYECNSKCKCGPNCTNRVVQNGKTDHKLCIFRTSNDCGWGVKTLKSIKKGSFVTLYVGEVVKSEEAEKREKVRDETACTYMFDLDFNDPDNYPYTVDASKYGNVSHFINHSCNPNLAVYAVWVDCLDPNLPKLAMFATRDISRNEELAFDYDIQLAADPRSRNRQDNDEGVPQKPQRKRTLCKCGSTNCRQYIL